MKNLNIYKRALALVAASSLVLMSGCSTKVDKNSNTDLNRAMISIGNECVAFDILEYQRWTDSHIELTLEDGTKISVHPSDLQLYNNNSEKMRKLEESISTIDIYDSYNSTEHSDYDKAFVQIGDNLVVLEISKYEIWKDSRYDSNTVLTLVDGTTMAIHPMDLILFNSNSLIMNQVEEQTLNNENTKTR